MTKNVIHIYRGMLKCAMRMPKAQREKNLSLIKEGFREGKNVTDGSKAEELLKKAQSSLGYLKIVTPRRKSEGQSGHTRMVFGEESNSSSKSTSGRKPHTNWTGSTPNLVSHHILDYLC